jgi:uncharacterized delta-60 repeat protein
MRRSPLSVRPVVPAHPRGRWAGRVTVWLLSVAAVLAWQLVAAIPAQANGGDLDPAFGVGGKVITDIARGLDQASAVMAQADGKIVAAGGADEGNGSALDDFAVVRYQADGSLDPRFGRRGKVKFDFTGAGGDDHANAVALQAGGGLVAAGFAVGDWAMARFDQRGRLDPAFGVGGKVRSPLGGQIRALAVQPDGKLVAAGLIGSDFAVARYGATGSLDPSFGVDGVAITDFPGLFAEAHAVALQSDGKIVAAGSAASQAFALARYNPDGTLDPGFGAGGTVTTTFGGFFNEANAVVVQAGGKIAAAGQVFGTTSAFALARYNPDGTLDPGFGIGGTVTTSFASSGTAAALVAQPGGALVAAGTADPGTGSSDDFALARYQDDGSLDSSFGTGGTVTTDFGGGTDVARALAVQADGKLLVAGSPNESGFGSDFALARYLTQ